MRYLSILIFSSSLMVAPLYAGSGHEHGDSHSHKQASEQKDAHSHANSGDHHSGSAEHHEKKEHGHSGGDEKSHGHSHGPMNKQAAVDQASMKIKQLASAGKIDKSWSSVKVVSAEKKALKNGPEWLVTFSNKKVNDKGKQTLYVFYSIDGKYLATNYSGK